MQRINFQPGGADVPEGYLVDSGQVFADRGNGFTYGWNAPTDTEDRGLHLFWDQKHDTMAWLDRSSNPDAVWEIALENGTYDVHVVCCDMFAPYYTAQVNNIEIEGTVHTDPDGNDQCDVFDVTVEITDGCAGPGSFGGPEGDTER